MPEIREVSFEQYTSQTVDTRDWQISFYARWPGGVGETGWNGAVEESSRVETKEEKLCGTSPVSFERITTGN